MAKSTSTTKAKTKTTKKPAAKTAAAKTTKKPAAKAKVTKATTAKKSTAKKAPAKVTEVKKSEAKKPVVTITRTWSRGYVFSGVILAVQAVLAVWLMKADSVQVFLGHLTKNELLSSAGTVLAPAAYPLYEVQLRWMLAVVLGVAAVFAILRGTRLLAAETTAVKARVNKFRWIETAVVGALLFELVALLNGVQDLLAIKFGMLAIVLGAYFAYAYEQNSTRANLLGARLSFLVPVLALLGTAWGTYLYGLVRSPWYTYAATALFIVGLVTVLSNLKRSQSANDQYYMQLDTRYSVYGTVVKVLVGVVLIWGLFAK